MIAEQLPGAGGPRHVPRIAAVLCAMGCLWHGARHGDLRHDR